MPDLHKILKQYWGFDAFRPLQEDVMQSVLAGNDTLALMPTGGGKSLCYQVPALARQGLCLVISPLIALMKDQVESLRRKNITAFSIYSGMTRQDVHKTLKTALNSNCKFLYVSPERLETSLFQEYLPGMQINLIAVDEAHCISQWGYDFRPPYLRIATVRKEIPGVPVLALTASATPAVQQDICDKLMVTTGRANQSSQWNIFRQSFERPNLSYSAFKVESRINKIFEILSKVNGCSIVYCKSRKRTKEIAELLQLRNIAADFYHAGLSQEERNRKQEDWIADRTRVIVCTNAFGMGIDKPDVRTVIHADVPDCLENYYQEAGRAGRDRKKSFAVLLYDEREIKDLEQLPSTRFPPMTQIREVYQAIANYLHVPAGAGANQYYDFDLGDFLKKFKIDTHTAINSLKALEQEDWLSLNEQVFLPPLVHFTTSKSLLYEFEKTHPTFEPLIKTLLRSYEGIFDQATAISEMLLSRTLKMEVIKLKEGLRQLHKHGIIEYQPVKEMPQLFFPVDRVRSEDLTINKMQYALRKDKFAARIDNMLRFVNNVSDCRSKLIGTYFGDDALKECGICDNCLKRHATSLTREEFDNIHHAILRTLQKSSLEAKDLLTAIGDIRKEKAWTVLEFLQAEDKIELDDDGLVRLK